MTNRQQQAHLHPVSESTGLLLTDLQWNREDQGYHVFQLSSLAATAREVDSEIQCFDRSTNMLLDRGRIVNTHVLSLNMDLGLDTPLLQVTHHFQATSDLLR